MGFKKIFAKKKYHLDWVMLSLMISFCMPNVTKAVTILPYVQNAVGYNPDEAMPANKPIDNNILSIRSVYLS